MSDDEGEFTVDVRRVDAELGVRGNGAFCMVARAAKRLPGATNVDVDGIHMSIGNRCWRLPWWVSYRIGAFDAELPVEPFKFTLRCADGMPRKDLSLARRAFNLGQFLGLAALSYLGSRARRGLAALAPRRWVAGRRGAPAPRS